MGGDYRGDRGDMSIVPPKKSFAWGDTNASIPQQLLLLVKKLDFFHFDYYISPILKFSNAAAYKN